ncbi:MAG: UrcA family protein [Pseudomonadota bacterium]
MVRNLLALAGLLAVALVAAIGIQAYDNYDPVLDADPPRLAVSYVGLDLATPEGVELLEGRINRAIDKICPDDRSRHRNLKHAAAVSRCRRDAVASVGPQVDGAIAAAERRAAIAERDLIGPPPPPHHGPAPRMPDYAYRGPPPVVQAPPPVMAPPATRYVPLDPAPAPHVVKVKRRTIVTRTVTTTVSRGYARRPAVAGSWLPPQAYRAIDHAIVRAFVTGHRTHWAYRDRTGYVTVGPKRWVNGVACRYVTAVKTSGGRAIVVAAGMRCRDRWGRLTSRDC